MKYAVLSMYVIFLFGCGHVETTDAGKNVVVKKSDPPVGCKEIETISAEGNFGGQGAATAQNKLPNNAAELGGNYLRLDTSGPGANVSGTVFSCP